MSQVTNKLSIIEHTPTIDIEEDIPSIPTKDLGESHGELMLRRISLA
jgi:hypothetical protein